LQGCSAPKSDPVEKHFSIGQASHGETQRTVATAAGAAREKGDGTRTVQADRAVWAIASQSSGLRVPQIEMSDSEDEATFHLHGRSVRANSMP